MTTITLTLDEIYQLAFDCLQQNGADEENAAAVAQVMTCAERDGSHSHGLFRLPAYVASLRSGKVRGDARPLLREITPSLLKLHGGNGYAPLAHQTAIPALAAAAQKNGVAVLAITHVHHMAALWHEVEMLAEQGLAAFACTTYMPSVAPAGARSKFFGTNPIAFAWPRPDATPLVFDMATAAKAMGEVQIAARAQEPLPAGVGLDKNGAETTDAAAIVDGGVLLPFGGYKGSAISLMVELLTAGLLHENFSYEAKEKDNGDGGPPQGGEFILALSPAIISENDWQTHCQQFFDRLSALPGVRLPGSRRHQNRKTVEIRQIDAGQVEKIRALMTSEQAD
ncbi:MAG: Ldh family oxidoreductase [Proteobacteria bacterium]|nr:Ldh family oxidoreductase [Pseudomonadota bacterium]